MLLLLHPAKRVPDASSSDRSKRARQEGTSKTEMCCRRQANVPAAE